MITLALTASPTPSSNTRFFVILGKNNEAHFPAVCGPSQAHARFSGPDAQPWRQGGDSRAARERAGAAGRLICAERYRRAQRLGSDAIAQVLATTRPRRAGAVSVQVRSNGLDFPRLGLVVPKRLLPRAVDRNRVRRLLREWFRRNQKRLAGKDLLVRLGARPTDIGSVSGDIERLFAAER